ncbi:competence protein CoiA family protein [Balneola vulgaris]|uniref:competence protein CoiA family protein n=1 Tax=Balneola vulgaris TaxID=287535 RepID=UPI000364AC5B|nr:competence protein CoiA family protein [Balneola vulgaris]
MIQYSFAKDSEGRIVKVTSLERNIKLDTYYCVNCGNELIARLGEIRRKHFAHKEQIDCSYETYLHKLSKTVFYRLYRSCLKKNRPFILEYSEKQICKHFQDDFNITCDLGQQVQDFDLTSYFTEIELEKRDRNLIPDVRIFNEKTGESIYVEIAVTHKSEENKVNSGNRILEFLVNEESDLKLFTSKRIELENEKIIRHNFSKSEPQEIDCDGNCPTSKDIFQVFKSGKSILTDTKLKKLKRHLKNDVISDFKIVDLENNYENYTYVQNVVRAHEKETEIKNCFLCRYHAKNKDYHTKRIRPIFCKFLKETFPSNQAVDCEYYRPDESVYAEYRAT